MAENAVFTCFVKLLFSPQLVRPGTTMCNPIALAKSEIVAGCAVSGASESRRANEQKSASRDKFVNWAISSSRIASEAKLIQTGNLGRPFESSTPAVIFESPTVVKAVPSERSASLAASGMVK